MPRGTMKMILLLTIAVALLAQVGCATTVLRVPVVRPPTVKEIEVQAIEQDIVAKRHAKYFEQKQFYDSVSFALARGNGPNCPSRLKRQKIGITTLTDRDFRHHPDAPVRFIPSAFGPTVQSVVPGSPADGQLIPGDVILNWNGTDNLPIDLRLYRPPVGESAFALATPYPPATLSLAVRPASLCPLVVFVESRQANAFTDGGEYFLTSALAGRIQNADEAALVLAHELAHLIGDHLGKMRKNTVVGGVIGAVLDVANCATNGICNSTAATATGMAAGARAFSREFEDEADYLAVLLMIRAGFDAEKAAVFWLRMAEQTGLGYSATHPAHARRYANTVARARAVAACAEVLGGPLFLIIPTDYFSREERINRRNSGVEGTCMR